MKKHFSEADLLETYYMQPGQSMPVMMHLASCSECAGRYERLERKLRESADACHVDAKPETFWTRQRLSIMRKVGAVEQKAAPAPRPWRMAAAAVLAFLLGSVVMYRTESRNTAPSAHDTPAAISSASIVAAPLAGQKTLDELPAAHDAWQSDELADFHNVVQWESWVADSRNGSGDNSL